LYVSNPYQNRIEIYDTETMKKISEWDLNRMGFSRPGQIAADKQGNLWIFLTIKTVIQGYDCDFQTIAQFSPDGKILPGRVTDFQEDAVRMMEKTGSSMSYTSDIHDTGPFCFGPDNTLYVFDPQLGIDVYPPESDGTNLGSFSSQKQKLLGICDTDQGCGPLPFFYPSGEFGDLRFGEYTVKALGCDANGNLYIAQDLSSSSGGAVLESYRILGDLKKPRYPFPDDWCQDKNDIPVCLDAKLNWRLFGLCFIDCATLDPDDETTAYTKDEKYKLDWSQPPGKEWSFLATTFQKSPDCNRSFLSDSAGVWIRNIRGRKFMFINDMNGQYLRRCEFDTPAYRKETNYREEEERMPGFSNWPVMKESEESILTFEKPDPVDDHVRQDDVRQSVYQAGFALIKCGHFREQERRLKEALKQEQSEFPPAQGWWVDLDCGIWRATETKGIFYIPAKPEQETDSSADDFCSDYFEADVKVFPHPTEFTQVKRIRYDAATDTLYLGGCATVDGVEHKNQHWKPMGAVICRYDHFLKGDNPGKTAGKLRWKIVVPYVTGSQGHESCEPMGFDIAGDYMFVPYTGASKVSGFKTGHVEVFRLSDGSSVGWMEPDQETIGEIGLQDIRECLSAHKRANGEYVIFLEDDYKAKVVMFRWQP
ncbi:MAG: hypothetical protein FWC50_08535, partial [Planctomycetaceae bacterium]|nr:hypothetical protein [Planctomycetaceae bacterium]